jgi:hypothetical protein
MLKLLYRLRTNFGYVAPPNNIPKPVWAVGFALEQTLHVVTLAVFSYVDFKVAPA